MNLDLSTIQGIYAACGHSFLPVLVILMLVTCGVMCLLDKRA
jgi:hypothetical protein